MKAGLYLARWLATLALVSGQEAIADVVINSTRVIYPADAKEVTIKLDNRGDTPSLVQAWLDTGDAGQTPEQARTPFVITPPISRIEAHRGQSLRLMFAGAPLATDRESVFWLNVVEVPPMPAAGSGRNYLQLAIRSRIKVFYRPTGLPGRALEAYRQLRWQVVKDGAGHTVAECSNPSPYFISFSAVAVGSGAAAYRSRHGGMVAPGGRQRFELAGSGAVPMAHGAVDFTVINDYGGNDTHQGSF